MSVLVETFGTENVDPERITASIHEIFALRPAAILSDLDLRRPIFQPTASYGHFAVSYTHLTLQTIYSV